MTSTSPRARRSGPAAIRTFRATFTPCAANSISRQKQVRHDAIPISIAARGYRTAGAKSPSRQARARQRLGPLAAATGGGDRVLRDLGRRGAAWLGVEFPG